MTSSVLPSPGQGDTPRAAKRRSIATKVGAGLLVIILMMIVISSLTAFGLSGFRDALSQLSNNALPRMVAGSHLTGLFNQLLFQTERLARAQTLPESRIAYTGIKGNISDIKLLTGKLEANERQRLNKDLKALESTLQELNGLVNTKISVIQKVDQAVVATFDLAEKIISLSQGRATVDLTDNRVSAISAWSAHAMSIINLSGKASLQSSLNRIKRVEREVKKQVDGLENLSRDLPEEFLPYAWALDSELRRVLLGPDGLMPLMVEKVKATSRSSGKGSFAASLVGEFNSSNSAIYHQLVRGTAEETKVLNQRVNRGSIYFLAMILVSLIIAVAVFLYIRSFLIKRLMRLNKAMLGRVAGRETEIEKKGNDEITDIASSFLYYVDEVGRRESSLQQRTMELGRALEELKRSEQRFQTIAANIPGAIFQAKITPGRGLEFLYVSSGSREHLGLDAIGLVQGQERFLIHREDRPQFESMIAGADTRVSDLEFMGRTTSAEGTDRWIHLVAKPSSVDEDRPVYNGLILDITKSKMAEADYLAIERRIAAMSQAVSDALVMLDGKGRVLFWNHAAEQLFGFSGDEARGMDFHDMVAPEEVRKQVREGLKHFAATGGGSLFGSTFQTTALNRNGKDFPVEVNLSSFQIDEEWFAVGTVRDITERKQAEEALRESEERVRIILNAINTGIIVVDPDTRTITTVNPVAAAMIGLERRDIVGRRCHEFICPEAMDNCPIMDLEKAVANEELVLLTAKGEEIPILKTVARVKLAGKEHLVESFVDLTELKRAEEELKQNLHDLERFNRLAIGREEKMIGLKEEINNLLKSMGRDEKYKIFQAEEFPEDQNSHGRS